MGKCTVQLIIERTDFAQALAIAIVVLQRPRQASLSLLFLFASILLAESAIIISQYRDIQFALGPIFAFMGIVVILNMPLRDPSLPKEDISPVYGPPTVKLRTPEDNLTPLQYMTVSWMGPLIEKGITRKMDDEDVWDLGWEFKHARLHEAFRKLEGSVTRRIFIANGMDALRTTSLNLLRLCASKSEQTSGGGREILTTNSTTDANTTAASAQLYEERLGIVTQCYNYLRFHIAICTLAFITTERVQPLVPATRIREIPRSVDHHAVREDS